MPDIPEEVIRPIIFVHGLAGSASQYQTQAMRFASNGYPDDRIVAFEYSTDGLAAVTRAATGGLNETLDQFVDTQRERFESDQVYLVCHSLGTRVCSQYLSDPERAMKVAKYIAIDGITGDSCPGDVPCMGVFVSPENTLGGNNLHLPSEAHVQVATSEASFAGQFRFLTGVDPERTQILPQEGRVKISGRVVYFPANEGADGTALSIWRVNPETGARAEDKPVATFTIDSSGNWGPVELNPQAHYELHLIRPERAEHHFYRQPFLRSSSLVRLNTSPEGSAIEQNTHVGPNHATLIITRDMEWWGDHPSGQNDILEISVSRDGGTVEASGNIIVPDMGNGIIGIHVHDTADSPAQTTLAPIEYFVEQPFQYGLDVYMPAATPPDGVITLVSTPRGDESKKQVINVPNWASSQHRISVIFNDYIQ